VGDSPFGLLRPGFPTPSPACVTSQPSGPGRPVGRCLRLCAPVRTGSLTPWRSPSWCLPVHAG